MRHNFEHDVVANAFRSKNRSFAECSIRNLKIRRAIYTSLRDEVTFNNKTPARASTLNTEKEIYKVGFLKKVNEKNCSLSYAIIQCNGYSFVDGSAAEYLLRNLVIQNLVEALRFSAMDLSKFVVLKHLG